MRCALVDIRALSSQAFCVAKSDHNMLFTSCESFCDKQKDGKFVLFFIETENFNCSNMRFANADLRLTIVC